MSDDTKARLEIAIKDYIAEYAPQAFLSVISRAIIDAYPMKIPSDLVSKNPIADGYRALGWLIRDAVVFMSTDE